MSDLTLGLIIMAAGLAALVGMIIWVKPWRIVRGILRALSLLFLALAVTLDRQVRTTFSETLADQQAGVDTDSPTWDSSYVPIETLTATEGIFR
jgi:hypothetical protein